MINYNNKFYKSIFDLAQEVNIPYTTILHRLDRGFSIENAVLEGKESCTSIVINGVKFQSLKEASKNFNVNAGTISSRLNSGWSAEEAVGLKRRERKKPLERTTNPVLIEGINYPSTSAAAKAYNFKPNVIHKRVKKGLTILQALELEPFPEWFVAGKGKASAAKKQKRLEKEIITGLKKCSCCKKEKAIASFHVSVNGDRNGRCKDCVSGAFLRYRYKISESQFWELYNKQKSKCAICSCFLELKKGTTLRPKSIVVDHCHASNLVRGILCSNCNTGLGMFKDNVESLLAAVEYLQGNLSSIN